MDKHYPKDLDKKWQDYWEKEKIYKFDPKKKGAIFSIDTPPPTVSGEMHLGHLFSYTHQDIIARFWRQQGKNVFYPFGLDDNGLPTERLVEKKKGVKGSQMDREEFIELCEETLKQEEPHLIQNWKKIGMSCDFESPYFTASKNVQKLSQELFLDLYGKERVYQKEAPIIWCPECQTAIAQAELEDKEVTTYFNDILFRLADSKKDIIISTTRPELLSSCVAIFVHPDDKKNKSLIGKEAIVPLFDRRVKIIADKKVDPEKGSGIVMCCTFGDTTDMEWYLAHSLPLIVSIGKDGKMDEKAGKYKGMKVKEARKGVLKDLEKGGLLKNQKEIAHIVNVHERCGQEVEILNTKQWFLKYLDLKDSFLKMGKEIEWYPDYMRQRYENWISGLSWDWCISRQRFYGVSIPLWYCKKCGKVLLPEEEDLPVNPLLDNPRKKCSCGSNEFVPEKDLLDTWFTSSLTPRIALGLLKDEELEEELFPMDLRPQAHDIINTWLFYTVVRSKLHFDKIPFRKVMISGFVLDPNGEKMSKSKGNVIKPEEMLEKYPIDSLRYWAAGSSLGKNLRFQENEIKKSHRLMTKLWNASRFALSHLEGFKKKDIKDKYLVDEWIILKLEETTKKAKKSLEKYEYAKARNLIEEFFWNCFCDNYLELIKWRLYNEDTETELEDSAKATLYFTLLSILKLFAPFLPHLTEEIYQLYFKAIEKDKSIHISLWPEFKKELLNKKAMDSGDLLVEITTAIRKVKSEQGVSLRKEVRELKIDCNGSEEKEIEVFLRDLKEVNNIQKVIFSKVKEGIKVRKSIKIKIEI